MREANPQKALPKSGWASSDFCVSPWAPPDQQLNITSSLIKWKTNNNEIPIAQCSANCVPGYRKVPIPGAKTCCYDCAPCSNGEISNTTDSENCFQCPDMEWPNKKRIQCIPMKEDFLTYSDDVLSLLFYPS
ncbi:vomeronasal type-2 receptor 116-like [Xenopus laevis]|uniref:Vomeronasal type-2 receptor 116-like n=1 Tax=Xenopus laevis TaxID=8355 RepID=A0A8J1MK76_XENLA|nr:vomeronasal type-2 receptor 116-like [Xenopus laevis]